MDGGFVFEKPVLFSQKNDAFLQVWKRISFLINSLFALFIKLPFFIIKFIILQTWCIKQGIYFLFQKKVFDASIGRGEILHPKLPQASSLVQIWLLKLTHFA
jgi:hypothetical protein